MCLEKNKMCKELTVLAVFLLGLLADALWLINSAQFGKMIFVQIGISLILLSFILIVVRKYLSRRFYLRRKSSDVSASRLVRSKFLLDFWKRQTPLPKV